MQVAFSGHETFSFRYGWLKKGVDAVQSDSTFFSNERAMVGLGVGKNMVQSIKHWCLAANLISGERGDGNKIEFELTGLGQKIISDNGYDAFLEDPATLWLLHWQFATNANTCTTWFYLFNFWHSVEFTKESIYGELQKWLEQNAVKEISEQLLRRDIDCCLRTYVPSRQKIGAINEETFDCPISELNLITELEDGKTYGFRRGEQKTLPNEILLYAIDEFWSKYHTGSNSIALEKLAYDTGSPGKVFKLDTESLIGRLDQLKETSGSAFSYRESAGIKQIFRHRETSAIEWLENYYANH